MQLSLSQLSLKNVVNKLENSIITVSGPAIAISGIIAGIDLLTGGSMFKDVRWLSLTWAICLLLTLDFQVLMLGARARRVYVGNKAGKRKVAEIILIIFIAAAISSVSVQMQSIIARSQSTVVYTDRAGQHVRNLTIDEATAQMGINPVALIWERSALVLVLIFMSGWFRDEEPQDSNAIIVTAQPAQALPSAEDLAQLIAQTVRSEVQLLAQSVKNDVRTDVQSLVQIAQPVIDYTQIAQAVAPYMQPQLTEVRRVLIEEVKAAMPTLIAQPSAQPAIAQRSTVRTEDDDDAQSIAQQDTMPVLEVMSTAQAAQSDARRRVFAFLDAYHEEHGKSATMPTNAVIMAGAPCAKNPASQYRREYYEEKRGGAQ